MFNPAIAKLHGVNEAIFIHHLQYIINYHKSHNRHYHDGRWWTYNSSRYLSENIYQFWNQDQIKKIIKSLVNQGVILVSNYNHHKYDRTAWYSFVDENRFLDPQPLEFTHCAKTHNALCDSTPSPPENTQSVKSTLPEGQSPESRIITHCAKTHNALGGTTPPIPINNQYDNKEREESSENIGVFSKNASLPQEVLLDSDKKKQKKGTRLAEDWVLPQEWRLWSSAHGMTNDLIEVNAMKFKNYWLSTNKNPVKVDWYRTWQNWCIDELQRKGIMVKDQSASTRPISAP